MFNLELGNELEGFLYVDGERSQHLRDLHCFLVEVALQVQVLQCVTCLLHLSHDILDLAKDEGGGALHEHLGKLRVGMLDGFQAVLDNQVGLHGLLQAILLSVVFLPKVILEVGLFLFKSTDEFLETAVDVLDLDLPELVDLVELGLEEEDVVVIQLLDVAQVVVHLH